MDLVGAEFVWAEVSSVGGSSTCLLRIGNIVNFRTSRSFCVSFSKPFSKIYTLGLLNCSETGCVVDTWAFLKGVIDVAACVVIGLDAVGSFSSSTRQV